MVNVDVGTLAVIVLTVTASCCMGYFLARVIWSSYDSRNRTPDFIYCGKCHQLVGQSSHVAPHQVNLLQDQQHGSQNILHPGNGNFGSQQLPGSNQGIGGGFNHQPQVLGSSGQQQGGQQNTSPTNSQQSSNGSAIFQRLGIDPEDKGIGIEAKELESEAFSPAQTLAPPHSILNTSRLEILSPRIANSQLGAAARQSINHNHSYTQLQSIAQTSMRSENPQQGTSHHQQTLSTKQQSINHVPSSLQNPQQHSAAGPKNQLILKSGGASSVAAREGVDFIKERNQDMFYPQGRDSVFINGSTHSNNSIGNHSDLQYEEDKNNQVRVLTSPDASLGRNTPVSKTPGNASGKRPIRQTASMKSRRSLKDFLTRKTSRISSKKSSLGGQDKEAEALEPLLNGESDNVLETEPEKERGEAGMVVLSTGRKQAQARNPGSPGNTANVDACLQRLVYSNNSGPRASNEKHAMNNKSSDKQTSAKKFRSPSTVLTSRLSL